MILTLKTETLPPPREAVATIFAPLYHTLFDCIVDAAVETQLASAAIDDAWQDQLDALERRKCC